MRVVNGFPSVFCCGGRFCYTGFDRALFAVVPVSADTRFSRKDGILCSVGADTAEPAVVEEKLVFKTSRTRPASPSVKQDAPTPAMGPCISSVQNEGSRITS